MAAPGRQHDATPLAATLSGPVECLPMAEPAQRLTHCPVCRYDLSGLPANHRCPECGFEYDDRMRVWHRKHLTGGAFVKNFTIYFGFLALLVFALLSESIWSFGWFVRLVALLSVGGIMAIVVNVLRRRAFIAVGSAGIIIGNRHGIESWLPWDAVVFVDGVELPHVVTDDKTADLTPLLAPGLYKDGDQVVPYMREIWSRIEDRVDQGGASHSHAGGSN